MLRRVIVMAMLSALTCAPAYAQHRQWNEGWAWVQQGPPPQQPDGRPGPRHKGGERHTNEGGRRTDEGGRRTDEGNRRTDEGTRRGGLTPDERRELNRDLQRANREIYRKGRDK